VRGEGKETPLSTPVSIFGNIFIDTLDTDLNASAAIGEHLVEVRLEAIVWTSFNRDSNTASPSSPNSE
jgi:hypothetical protein